MEQFDWLAALMLVFFVSIPLVAAVRFFLLAFKRGGSVGNRVMGVLLALVALVFTYWVSFEKGEWVCADAANLLAKRTVLFALLLPSAYFIEKAYGKVWTNSEQPVELKRVAVKAVLTFLIAEAVGVGCYTFWLRFVC